jgi:hypothetical protein
MFTQNQIPKENRKMEKRNDFLKETIVTILKGLIQNGSFLSQIAAEVSALRTITCALDPKIQDAFEKQLILERNKLQPMLDEYRTTYEQIQKRFPKMMS